MEGFVLKSDLFFWYGEKYRVPTTLKQLPLNPALDFNIGGEYQILKWMGIWVQLNNILIIPTNDGINILC